MANASGAVKLAEGLAQAGPTPAPDSGEANIKTKAAKPSKVLGVAKKFGASIYPRSPLPETFVKAVQEVEEIIKAPVWLIIQDAPPSHPPPPFHLLDDSVLNAFLKNRSDLPTKPISIIIDSPGGEAKAAYQLANLFRLHCGGFNVYIPEWAKSAATLFVLGASNIYLLKYAELGPLDVQIFDPEREGICSALDEVQALERLNAFALQAVDAGMLLLKSRSGKSVGTLLPHLLHFVSEMLRPLFEKLDTVHYTQMSRMLKIGEAYAVRLLEPTYGEQRAEKIARQLVNEYPEHGFYIDRNEAAKMGLKTARIDADLENALENVKGAMHAMNRPVVVGRVQEIQP